MNTVTESGKKERSPRVKDIFRLSVEKERPDAERDGQTSLAKPNSQARTGTTVKNKIPLFS